MLKKPDTSAARIATLSRYIASLRREQTSLQSLSTSSLVSTFKRKDAETKAKSIAEKLDTAERELIILASKKSQLKQY